MELGYFYLLKGLYWHKTGNISQSINFIKKATDIFTSINSEEGKAEVNLSMGIIFEDTHMESEAAKSYFDALDYFCNHQQSASYFLTLMGLARTAPDKEIFFKQAEEYLDKNPDTYFSFYLIKTRAFTEKDIVNKHRLFLKALKVRHAIYDPREVINLYASLALDCQMMEKNDSAIYYLNTAGVLVKNANIPNSRLLHYLLIKAYIIFHDGRPDDAFAILDSAIKYAKNQPGMLSQVYLRKAEIDAYLKNYQRANLELLRYLKFEREEINRIQKNRLELLTIRYQLHQKQIELLKQKNRWLLATVSLLIIFISFATILIINKNRAYRERQAMKDLVSMTIMERDALQKRYETLSNKFRGKIKEDKVFVLNAMNVKSVFKWEDFRISFITRHPFFVENLTQKHPHLTATDVKYCMCISCGMTNQQIARLLNITQDAVKKAKRKLRKKFNLESVHYLAKHLNSIENPSTGQQSSNQKK